jgi:hypothetical protein
MLGGGMLEKHKIPDWQVLYLRHLFKRKKKFDLFSVFSMFDLWWKRNVLKLAFFVWYE